MKRYLLILSLILAPLVMQAENLIIESPYSRYGYGDIQSQSVGLARAMGGIGYGVRDRRVINPMNPASYSSIDSLTFMMNLAGSGTVNGISDGTNVSRKARGMVDYVNFQFPIYKSLALSLGLSPFSCVGYSYSSSYQIPDVSLPDTVTTVNQSYSGTGGFTQVYLGLAYDIMDRVSIGVNGKYMFGEISYRRDVSFPDKALYTNTSQSATFIASTFLCDVGVQYHQPIKKDLLVVGATYSIKLPMAISSQMVTTTNKTVTDNLKYDFDFPMTIGVGASYKMRDVLLIGADFEWRDWSHARYLSVTDTLKTTFKVAFGAEYVYKPGSKKYADNLRYRLGARVGNSYTVINNSRYLEFAITTGLGFPLFNNLTTINVFFEYGHRGDVKGVGIVEDYFKFGLDLSLNERWFVKRKLN